MTATAAWNKTQRHIAQDVDRHRLEASKRTKDAAVMEVQVLERLQLTSNVEIQRLLRRDQRSSEIERQASKAWADCAQRLTVTAMMYSAKDYRLPSTAERLRRIRDEIAGKRSWAHMMGAPHDGHSDETAEADDSRTTGDDPSIPHRRGAGHPHRASSRRRQPHLPT